MRKILALLLCLLLIGMVGTAMAAEYEPGDEFTITLAITATNFPFLSRHCTARAPGPSLLSQESCLQLPSPHRPLCPWTGGSSGTQSLSFSLAPRTWLHWVIHSSDSSFLCLTNIY